MRSGNDRGNDRFWLRAHFIALVLGCDTAFEQIIVALRTQKAEFCAEGLLHFLSRLVGLLDANMDISGNPDRYDIDAYLAARPAELLWLVTRVRVSFRHFGRTPRVSMEEPRSGWCRRRRHCGGHHHSLRQLCAFKTQNQ